MPIVFLIPFWPMLMLAPGGPSPRLVPALLKFSRIHLSKGEDCSDKRSHLYLEAANLINDVQEIWMKHYGKRNERVGYGPPALEIAAYYMGVSANAVELARHNRVRTVEKSILSK